MNPNDENLKKVLNFDALAEAERLTGKSYKEDDATKLGGLGMMMANNRAKENMLKSRDDTTICNRLDNYVRIITDIGFRQVLVVPFEDARQLGGSAVRTEELQIWWDDRGLLLHFDTYWNRTSVNSGKLEYAWKPKSEDAFWDSLPGGHMTKGGIWMGNHDCREALRFKIQRLSENGEFVNPWPPDRRTAFWLTHYMDHHREEGVSRGDLERLDRVTAKRLAMLPDDVRKGINRENQPK